MPDPYKLAILTELREGQGLTQEEMAQFFDLKGKKGRDSVGAWERGQSVPRPFRRDKFIDYLCSVLELSEQPDKFQIVWGVLEEEWGWEPLSDLEWRKHFEKRNNTKSYKFIGYCVYKYNRIHYLLNEGFSEDHLLELCEKTVELRAILDHRYRVSDKAELAHHIISQADKSGIIEEILDWASTYNPVVYTKYQPYCSDPDDVAKELEDPWLIHSRVRKVYREIDNVQTSTFFHLHSIVRRLTEDQYRVIQMLSGEYRVRISGSAGSGKTLVAAEKAFRLSRAGIRTLFLCHNPLLADYIRKLIAGSGVTVAPIGEWVANLAGVPWSYTTDNWTNYEDPEAHILEAAFDKLVEQGPYYDAVIVDEGQDFRDEWWIIAEASLANSEMGIFYIFHDDNQSLLPNRAKYPFDRPTIDLSRNCRNAGKIYEVMRRFYASLPLCEISLKDMGEVIFHQYVPGSEKKAIEEILHRIDEIVGDVDIVILLGGLYNIDTTPLAGLKIKISSQFLWQDALRKRFEQLLSHCSEHDSNVKCSLENWNAVKGRLTFLSDESVPGPEDIERVRKVASAFKVERVTYQRVMNTTKYHHYLYDLFASDSELRDSVDWAACNIVSFDQGHWAAGISETKRITLLPYHQNYNGFRTRGKVVRMYNVADFKGLEADVVLLLVGGWDVNLEQQLYVGISRARFFLIALIDRSISTMLPYEQFD